MSEPLIDPALAETDGAPVAIAVLHSENHARHTPMHSHSRGQLLGAQRGLITVGLDQAKWLVPASHAVWLPPHSNHELHSHGNYSGWSVYIAASNCAALPDKPCTLLTNSVLRATVARAATWIDLERNAAQRRLEDVILDEIRTMPEQDLGLPMPEDGRLLRIAGALLDNLADQRSAEAWADLAGLSPRHFQRRFAAETGFGFDAWRRRARLMKALEMLANGRPVTVIALELGYDNVSAFIDMFRRHFGVTPAKYPVVDDPRRN